jgi:hypothetical protein
VPRTHLSPRRRARGADLAGSSAPLLALCAALAFAAGAGCSRSETASPTAATAPTSSAASADSGDTTASSTASATTGTGGEDATTTASTTGGDATLADVLSVSAAGTQWSVEIRSPDAGCERYADWWEVVTPGGELVYRRILAHSHVDEQPFTRSGGPVEVDADAEVIVRAHMNPGGYGGQALRGSAGGGFTVDATITADFAAQLDQAPPLPDSCAF